MVGLDPMERVCLGAKESGHASGTQTLAREGVVKDSPFGIYGVRDIRGAFQVAHVF